MALTDRIAALTVAIANAFNARVQSPASGYDIAKLNGYTGTQAQWLADFSDPGNTDYAAQFNSQLGSIPTAGIATEAQAGVTQLSTFAEVGAATVATKAISPFQLLGVIGRYANLTALVAALPTTVEGGIAVVGRYQFGSTTYYHERSAWQKTQGVWQPIAGTTILVSTTGIVYVGEIQTAAVQFSNFVSSNTSSIGFPVGTVVRSTQVGSGSNTPIEVSWTGTGWLIWNCTNVASGYGGFLNGATGDTNAGNFDMSVSNGIATWSYNIYRSAGNFSTGVSYYQMVPGWRPVSSGGANNAGVNFVGNMYGGPTVVSMYLGNDGNLFWVNGGTAGQALRGTVTYRLQTV